MSTQHVPFCRCSDPNCPAVAMMRAISAMPTNGDVWSIETVAGFTMAERHRAAFAVSAFAIFYAGHGEDNYKIFKAFAAPED